MKKSTHPLRRWRQEQQMTQAELAAKLGCSHTYICHIETGREQPADKFIKRAAKLTRIAAARFVNGART